MHKQILLFRLRTIFIDDKVIYPFSTCFKRSHAPIEMHWAIFNIHLYLDRYLNSFNRRKYSILYLHRFKTCMGTILQNQMHFSVSIKFSYIKKVFAIIIEFFCIVFSAFYCFITSWRYHCHQSTNELIW